VTTLTVQPSEKDNHLSQNVPTANYGDSPLLELFDRLNNYQRLLVEFDISELPGEETLISATLQLYYDNFAVSDPVGKTIWAYKLTRTNWVELESTWNIYKTGSNWTTPGGDYVTSNPSGGSIVIPASPGWVSFDVLAIVQDAYDSLVAAEFLIRYETELVADNGQSIAYFRSKEHATEATRPKLVIKYGVVGRSRGYIIG